MRVGMTEAIVGYLMEQENSWSVNFTTLHSKARLRTIDDKY